MSPAQIRDAVHRIEESLHDRGEHDAHTHQLLHQVLEKMSVLSDAVALVQSDLSSLGTAIADVKTRVDALSVPSDAADVAAAVTALGQAHTDVQTAITNLAAIPTPAAP